MAVGVTLWKESARRHVEAACGTIPVAVQNPDRPMVGVTVRGKLISRNRAIHKTAQVRLIYLSGHKLFK